MRIGEVECEAVEAFRRDGAGHVGLAVARLGRQRTRRRGLARDPGRLAGAQLRRQQPRVVVALHDVQRVAGDVLARHEPRLAGAVRVLVRLQAADADALALAQRVERQAHVLAHGLAVVQLDRARLVRQVAAEEFAERALADEADAGRILLGRIRQVQFFRDLAHFRLGDLAQREQRLRQLRLVQAVQEVALVLGRIEGLEQLVPVGGGVVAHARVVAGRDQVGAQLHRVVEEGLELDLGIAQHVRVRRAAGLVFAQEFREHAVLVLGGEVDGLDVHADDVGHAGRVDPVLARGTVFGIVVVFPVLHEQADDFIALFLQHPGRDRGVDAARHPDHDFLFAHFRLRPV